MSGPYGIVQLAVAPPVATLQRSTSVPTSLSNPYSGSGSLSPTSGGAHAFGLHWEVNTVPSDAGRSSRSIVIYEQPFLSFALHYILADASDFIGDNVLSGAAEGFFIWSIGLPDSLEYDILPGWTVHFDWLIGS